VPLQTPSTSAVAPVDADLDQVRKALIAALADAALMAKVHRAVEACARVPRDSLIARELVADVVDDTYRGCLRWNLKVDLKVGFLTHVLDKVRRQLHRNARKRRNHIPLDELRDHDRRLLDPAGEPERERDIAVLRERIARARQQLGAEGDPAALQLLTFWELGVTRRRDLSRLGLTGWTYRAAYDRLWELFATLDTAPMPETEQGTEQPVFRRAGSEGAVTPLTPGHRIGPKRADTATGRSSTGATGTRIGASRRRSRKRPPE
jgi:hypothetical protein